jgi:hypothetical protein
MFLCPLCEHPQPSGDVCEECGRPNAEGAGTAVSFPRVEGLEPTRFEPAEAAEELVPGLEPTAHEAVDLDTETGPPLELERTAADPVDVSVDPTPDVERIGDGIADDVRTVVPALTVCRYCRETARTDERVCARCGMRLPVFDTGPPAPAARPRLCSCGARVRGSVCPACGARVEDGA